MGVADAHAVHEVPSPTAAVYHARALTAITSAYALVGASALVITSNTWHSHLWLAFLLTTTSIVAARYEVMVGRFSFSGEFVPILGAALIAPPIAPLVACGSAASRNNSTKGRIANTAAVVLAASVASLIAHELGFPADDISTIALGATASGAGFLAANLALVMIPAILAGVTTFQEYAPVALASMVATSIFMLPIVSLVVLAYEYGGIPLLPFVLVPLAIAQYFQSLYQRKVQLTDELAQKAQLMARANLQFAAAMVRALDARDAYTAGHSAAVAVYCRDIAREAGMDEELARLAHLAGLLHDIGKIGVRGSVLNKTAPLDDEEFEQMKEHAAIGAAILGEVDSYAEISVLVRHHHERIDGRGYPDGIGGEFIPAISRIISVADTYSAMTTDRPYRDGMDPWKAMKILDEVRGTQLDEDFVIAFLAILARENDDYRRGHQTDFEVEVAKHQALSAVEQELLEPLPALPPAAVAEGVDIEREAA